MSTSAAPLSHYRIVLCGIEGLCRALIDDIAIPEQCLEIPYDLAKFAEQKFNPEPVMFVFGTPPAGVNLNEAAQVARMQFPHQPVFYVTTVREKFDRVEFQRNGFTDAFLIPLDQEIATQTLRDELARASRGAIRSFRPIQLIDLQSGEVLDFDTFVFMPANRKHLQMTSAGDDLEADRHEKLTKSGVNAVHVTSLELPKFYRFAAKKLRLLQKGDGISETERKARMADAIRNLMASVYNDDSTTATIESGRSVLSDCQAIVKSFITEGIPADAKEESWYAKVLQITGAESGTYHHAGNVATFGALFSLAVGLGKPEDVALAGLLHDLGMAELPPEIQARNPSERTPDEEEQYRRHVEHSLELIKFRKMVFPDTVTKAIGQHHERWSGAGYPKGLAGTRISPEAQILSLADQFDYLTMTREGKPRMRPPEAFKTLYNECLIHPEKARFDLELLKKFIEIFPDKV